MVTDVLIDTDEDIAGMAMDTYTGMATERNAAIGKNIDRFAEHMLYIMHNLDEAKKIPNGASLIYDDDREFGEKLRHEGYKVVYVKKDYEYY
jgi:hypothetical protein